MNVSEIAQLVSASLIPLLPYLIKASEGLAEKIGEDAWTRAKSLWHLIEPALLERPAGREAIEDAANTPVNEDCQAAFRLQVTKALQNNPALLTKVLQHVGHNITQQIEADNDSQVRRVNVIGTSDGRVRQSVKATNKSTIEDISVRTTWTTQADQE